MNTGLLYITVLSTDINRHAHANTITILCLRFRMILQGKENSCRMFAGVQYEYKQIELHPLPIPEGLFNPAYSVLFPVNHLKQAFIFSTDIQNKITIP